MNEDVLEELTLAMTVGGQVLRKLWASQMGLPGGSTGEESACNTGDMGSIPRLVRSPGEGNSYPLQYSGLENSMDCKVHGVTKSWTWLSNFHFTSGDHLPMQETDMRCWFNSWVREILWRRAWQHTPVFLPGESHGQRSLVGYSP